MTKKSKLNAKQVVFKYGVKSGLEEHISDELTKSGITFSYEPHKLSFTQPAKARTYTPDFLITNTSGYSWYLETKGRFLTADRLKHIMIKDHIPDLDLRFLFTNANDKISKTSKTTYGKWCEQYGFKYATKVIPKEWFDE